MKILEKILYYGLILTLLTPLVIGESLIFPFVTTKAYFFYILIDILLIVYLLLLSQKKIYPQKSKLLLIFIGITLLGLVLDLFGVSFKNSFWGNYERMMGVYTSIHFLIYLWLLISVFNHKGKYYKLLNISLVFSLLIAIYGFLQYFQVNFFGMVSPADNRIIATFGNAAFLAGFAMVFIFIALYLFFKTQNKYLRVFYLVSILANIVIMLMTATRGALVGLASALLVILVLLILFYRNNKIKIASGALLVIMILLTSSIFVFKDSALIKNNLALRRISEINLQEATTASRLALWKMSLEATNDRPIAGYGQNNVRIPLDKYHDYNLVEEWFDSSHNKFLDELLAHGLIGFLAQLFFFGALFWALFKKRKQDIIGSIILIGLLVAYLVQALFIFDSFVLSVLLMLVLGLILVRDSHHQEKMICNKNLAIYISIPLAIVLIVFFAWWYNNNISAAKIMAASFEVKGDDIGAMELYEAAEDKLFINYDILAPIIIQKALDIFQRDNYDRYTDVQLNNFVDLATRVYTRAIKDSGGYSKFYVNLAKTYQLASRHPRLDYMEESMDLLNKAKEISPNRIDIYYALAQSYYFQNDIDRAEQILEKALSIGGGKQADYKLAQTYYNLAQIQSHKGDTKEALYNLQKAFNLGQKQNYYTIGFNQLEEFAKIFISREDWESTVEVFIMMHNLEPDNLDIYYNVALAYSKNNKLDFAKEWIDKILVKDPSREEALKQFINSL